MPTSLNAALCGLVGAIAANVAYVRSNLYILGDVTRRGRHPLWDPAAFTLMGLVSGVVIGIVASRIFAASPVKAVMIGLSATLLGVAVVGGTSTYTRYRELYYKPGLAGPSLVLEFELRLPAGLDPAGPLPDTVAINEGAKEDTRFALSRDAMRISDGRIIMSGSVPLRKAAPSRLLTFPHQDNWYAIFTLLLHETPTEQEFQWTEWEEERNPAWNVAESQQYHIRYRVQRGGGA